MGAWESLPIVGLLDAEQPTKKQYKTLMISVLNYFKSAIKAAE